MLLKEIIAVYNENHAKPINIKCNITDCQNRWFLELLLGLTGLMPCSNFGTGYYYYYYYYYYYLLSHVFFLPWYFSS
jgi:hypothetical protein